MSRDADAVARTRAGDSTAFEELVHRYTAVAHAVAHAVVRSTADAEDVVQDAFLTAYRKIDSCRDPANFRGWLLRIVRNRAYNLVEYQRVRRSDAAEEARPAAAADPELSAERSQLREQLRRALDTLKPVWREVIWLHDVEGFTHAEIGSLLGTSVLMSRKHLMNARRRLRRELPEHIIDS